LQPKKSKVESNQKQDEFKLRISGKEIGKYSYSIDCDKSFFEISGLSDVESGLLKLQIEMEILEKMILLDFHFKGELVLPCDRCLDPVSVPLDFKDNLVVKLVAMMDEPCEEDDLWIIDENTYELDLFHFVYESILLALPIQVLHPDDEAGNPTCNPLILSKLKELSRTETQFEEDTDPRWDALKNIKNDQ